TSAHYDANRMGSVAVPVLPEPWLRAVLPGTGTGPGLGLVRLPAARPAQPGGLARLSLLGARVCILPDTRLGRQCAADVADRTAVAGFHETGRRGRVSASGHGRADVIHLQDLLPGGHAVRAAVPVRPRPHAGGGHGGGRHVADGLV